MRNDGFKWMVWGVLASAAAGVVGCAKLPQQAGNDTYQPGFTRDPKVSLYNGTIQQIPTSIDPRTPDKQGTPNRSLLMDPGERALLGQRQSKNEELGMGGSGPAPLPGTTPYLNLGATGSVIAPSNQMPAAQSLPSGSDQPTPFYPSVLLKK
ncbi:hypothetical protein F0U62_46425 [Cystobacter fuscus]|uniref:hypothetical protein n=1 Tax=Cystobacter fuscus TaxID=43 RepID=UPI002B2C6E95|nr:hypothetical protein F0U62_46425 [Cystobacter fuscus]